MKVYIIDPFNPTYEVFKTRELANEYCDREYPGDLFIKDKIEGIEVIESLEEK